MGSLDIDNDIFAGNGTLVPRRVLTPGLRRRHQISNLPCDTSSKAFIFQGDIVLKPPPTSLAGKVKSFARGLGLGKSSDRHLWPNGIIPFTYKADLKDIVLEAIEHWETNTPLKFVNFDGTQKSHVLFNSESGVNSSPIGRAKGLNEVSLVPTAKVGTAVHEIGHIIGLWHENARSDYAEHISINWDNVNPKFKGQFQSLTGLVELGVYDLNSIMHYPKNAFPKEEGLITITALDGSPIGQRNGLSSGDILAVQELYPQLDWSNHIA